MQMQIKAPTPDVQMPAVSDNPAYNLVTILYKTDNLREDGILNSPLPTMELQTMRILKCTLNTLLRITRVPEEVTMNLLSVVCKQYTLIFMLI